MKIACWSGPRTISTALMRSWSSRKDTFVTDEPLYAYYLKNKKLRHPMYQEILETYDTNFNKIIKNLESKIPLRKKYWYQKHMAHHLIDLNNIDWIKGFENCILIRNPKDVISSYTKKNKLINIEELGYTQQVKIVKFLIKSKKEFIIIDSDDLLQNPKKYLSEWCIRIGIKFDQSMLKWRKGNHPNDGIWSKHWYDNVIKTTGFQKIKKKDNSIENKYVSIYNEAMHCYEYLKELQK